MRGVAVGEGGVWAVGADATVTRIDPKAGRLVKTIPLGVYPPGDSRTIAVGEGFVWVPTLSP